MPSFNLTGFSSVARVLDNEDVGFIGQNGALVTTGDAVSGSDAAGAYAMTVLGAISANDGNAIDVTGRTLEVFVGRNGSISNTGVTEDAIEASISTYAEVINNGDIYGTDFGIGLFSTDGNFNADVINHGTISGGSGGVVFQDANFGSYDLVNTGTISSVGNWAVNGNAVDSNAGTTFTIINSGVMQSTLFSVQVARVALDLSNSGTMTGDINVFGASGDRADRVINTGLIEGDIFLAAGDDFLDSRGGEIVDFDSVENDINMGDGNDIAYGSNLSDEILGGAGEDRLRGYTGDDEIYGGDDNDDVRGGAGDDFVLGDGGDDMVHGGQGDDRVRGNAGNDEVRGGAGDDVVTGGSGNDIVAGGRGDDDLYGNSGADVFEFNLSAGFDIIHDYRDELDMIDLSAFGTRFNRVAAATETVNGNAVIDLEMLGGEGTIVIRGAGGDLDAGDFIF